MKVVRIESSQRAKFQEPLAALEKLATYPLGLDKFQIDHGRDYFAFFDRLGDVQYVVATEGERVVAAGCGMLRRVPSRDGGPLVKAWYVGDLKVHPDFRGRRIPLRMLARRFVPSILRAPRGYAISMNPPGDTPNRVVRLASRFRFARLTPRTTLELFSLDLEAMREVEPLVREHRGPVSYLSLAGVKDIVLASTGRPMPLVHLQFGPCAQPGDASPTPGATHMFCAPSGDPLSRALASRGIAPTATATVIALGMRACDWRFVLTSDI